VVADSQDKPTVGAIFTTAREALGISAIEAADLLNLTQRTIEALEKDDYEGLPSRVYVNGYVRAYAKMLGLDADDLVAKSAALHVHSDEMQVNDDAKESDARQHVNKMPISLTLKQWGYVGGGLVGCVLLISFFDEIPRPNTQPVERVAVATGVETRELTSVMASSLDEPKEDQDELDSALLAAVPKDVVEAPNANNEVVPDTDVVEADDATLTASNIVDASGAVESEQAVSLDLIGSDDVVGLAAGRSDSAVLAGALDTAPVGAPVEATTVEIDAAKASGTATEGSESPSFGVDAAVIENEFEVPYFGEDESGARKLSLAGDDQLRFEFAADCWVEIRSADDVLLYADLGRAGQVRRFVGAGPFKLKIGFADGIKLFFDSQEVDLAPYTRDQIARLDLGE
jgi:cytoskeleton protein RodZ